VSRTGDSGEAVLERVRELPGGGELLRVVADRGDAELIGGATRDLLLERAPRELDVLVAGDAEELAKALAGALSADSHATARRDVQLSAHERFGTALVVWDGGRVDIATRRAESYASPGALPDVRPGTPEDDLRRRDFSVNAIAVALAGANAGRLRAAPEALEDLRAGRLRVLHERSFIDDPTRLLRLARYRARLGFEVEPHTAALAAEALEKGALGTVSPARLGAELRLALSEEEPLASLSSLAELGVLAALDPPLRFGETLARRGLAALPADGRRDLLLLASLLASIDCAGSDARQATMRAFLDRLEFGAAERDRAIAAALQSVPLLERLAAAGTPSQLRKAIGAAPPEAIALAGALDDDQDSGRAAAGARRWLAELRHVQLRISGDDLLAAGLAPGPEIGRRLGAVLDMRLDGALGDSPEAQLRAALELAS
jgi:tRNA nucleotidyltransferase (CCA-adding enzyme)